MATDAFLVFFNSAGAPAVNEVAVSSPPTGALGQPAYPFQSTLKLLPTNYFEVREWDLSSVQSLNIGSQSTGVGAGKVVFNPFSITRHVDRFSETLFLNECSGTPFKYVDLLLRKSSGTVSSGPVYLAYRFGLCAVKTIEWSNGDELPNEHVSFEYGQLTTAYAVQDSSGKLSPYTLVGWDRVRNVKI